MERSARTFTEPVEFLEKRHKQRAESQGEGSFARGVNLGPLGLELRSKKTKFKRELQIRRKRHKGKA